MPNSSSCFPCTQGVTCAVFSLFSSLSQVSILTLYITKKSSFCKVAYSLLNCLGWLV